MNRSRQLIKFGSQEIAIPPVMIAYDGKGNQQIINTTTPKQKRLKVYRGKTALNLTNSNTPTKVEKIPRTAIIETAEIKKPRKYKKKAATTIQSAIRGRIARNVVRQEVANIARNQSIQNMQRDVMIGGLLNDIINNVPNVSQIKNERNVLPNPLLIEAPRPKIEVKPKETPKVKQQIVAQQAAIASTSTFDATRTFTREQLDTLSEQELSDLLTSIMGNELAPRKGIDPEVATDVYNALQRSRYRSARANINRITEPLRAKTNKSRILENAPGATSANMIVSSNVIAQQLEEVMKSAAGSILGAKIKRKLDENKNKAATKIQSAFKKLKDKNDTKKDLRAKLSKEKIRRLNAIKALNERLILEQDALKRYSNDNPKKFAKMQIQIQKTNNQIQMYQNQFNFLADKLDKL
jgi:hypothetical protein